VQALAWDDLRAVGEVRVDPNPGEIAVSDDGRRLVVTHFDLAKAADTTQPIEARRATIAVLDPTTLLPSGTPEPDKLLACVAPHGLALSRPDGRTAFVACYGESAIAILDLADVTTPVTLVPAGGTPYGVALSPDGARLATGTREGKEVRFLDVAARTMEPLVVAALGETYVPTWSADGASLYVPTRDLDAVAKVDARTGATIAKRVFDATECVAPLEVARASDAIVLVCEGNATSPGAMLVLDATTLATRSRAPLGPFPGRPFVGRGP
jgi:DNA-binding beta-propeller fold protein YncE